MNKSILTILVLVGCLVSCLYILQENNSLKVKQSQWSTSDSAKEKSCKSLCENSPVAGGAEACGRRNRNCCRKWICKSAHFGVSYNCEARVYVRGCTEELLVSDCEESCRSVAGRALCQGPQGGKHCCVNGCDPATGGCRRGNRGPGDTGIIQLPGCKMLIR